MKSMNVIRSTVEAEADSGMRAKRGIVPAHPARHASEFMAVLVGRVKRLFAHPIFSMLMWVLFMAALVGINGLWLASRNAQPFP